MRQQKYLLSLKDENEPGPNAQHCYMAGRLEGASKLLKTIQSN